MPGNYIWSLLLLLLATKGYATPTSGRNSHNDCLQERAAGSNPGVGMVTIKRDGSSFGSCPGALISDRHILVAGHCASVKGTKEVIFASSMTPVNTTESSTRRHQFSKVTVHPQFNKNVHDIAIMELATPLDLKVEKLIPVCLPQSDSDAVSSVSLFAFEKNRDVYTLHEYEFVTVSSEECQQKYGTFSTITPRQICAKNKNNNNKKEVRGGGSMMALIDGHFYLMGQSSFGVTGDNDYPEVFTRVWSYLDWIDSIVKHD